MPNSPIPVQPYLGPATPRGRIGPPSRIAWQLPAPVQVGWQPWKAAASARAGRISLGFRHPGSIGHVSAPGLTQRLLRHNVVVPVVLFTVLGPARDERR